MERIRETETEQRENHEAYLVHPKSSCEINLNMNLQEIIVSLYVTDYYLNSDIFLILPRSEAWT